MQNIEVDLLVARELAKRIRHAEVPRLDLYDTRYYPSVDTDVETVARYLITMVAMDHRLSRPNRVYEAIVDGELHHGADLLYYLGKKKLDEDPEWFSPEHLMMISREEVLKWLSPDKNVSPPDLDVRVRLLRDLGRKLVLLYNGRVTNLIEEAESRILSHYGKEGLLNRLRVFMAYNDPVEKKSHLFIKFLVLRKLFSPRDPENKRVPVDNHLSRIAIRTGLIRIYGRLYDKLRDNICFTEYEDVYLRFVIREAWHNVAIFSGVDDYWLDDFLWMFGRTCCTRERPVCASECNSRCKSIRGCINDCIFSDVCKGWRKKALLTEHCYLDTYYY